MIFIHYPKCSTCKNAAKHLEDLGFSLEKRDIVNEKLNASEIKEIYLKSKLDISKFFNTSGILYRQNNLKDKLKDMSLDEKIELLSTNGMLVKRPILITEDKVLVGYKKDEYEGLVK